MVIDPVRHAKQKRQELMASVLFLSNIIAINVLFNLMKQLVSRFAELFCMSDDAVARIEDLTRLQKRTADDL